MLCGGKNKQTIWDDGVDEPNHEACQDFVAEKQWNGQIMNTYFIYYIYISN